MDANELVTDYNVLISNKIKDILLLDNNRYAAEKFWEILGTIKPKSCIVKYGWFAGEAIDFLLAFEKEGSEQPFELFIENIDNKPEVFGFISGLNPAFFYIKHNKAVDSDTHIFIDIRFKTNG